MLAENLDYNKKIDYDGSSISLSIIFYGNTASTKTVNLQLTWLIKLKMIKTKKDLR